jgi:endonuclease/exonuclease/phosphatase family metal-dependent hydrolase
MTFNIEYGGTEVDFAKIVEALRVADPDVVGIEEGEGNIERLATELGWPYFSTRLQLVSKLPLIDPPGADGVYELVEVAPGAVVAIANVHLPSDPYGPYWVRDGEPLDKVLELERTTRLAALQPKLDVLSPVIASGIPALLVGDFNAPTARDWADAAVALRPHMRYAVEWPVSVAVEDAGFRDSYRDVHPDPIAEPGLTWWAGRPLIDGYPDPSEPQDRIDLVYAAGVAEATESVIVGEEGGPGVDIAIPPPWGTDHRGVMSTFRSRPGVPPVLIAVDRRLVRVGDTIDVRFHSGPGLEVRVVIGAPDGTTSQIVEQRVDVLDGELPIETAGLEAGAYEARLVEDGRITASAPFWVAAPDAPVDLRATATRVRTGEPIDVEWRNAPGNRWDWIGLYPRGSDPNVADYLGYLYTRTAIEGSVTFDAAATEITWPLPPGEYEVHYLVDDGYRSIAVAPFTVTR